MGLAVRDKKLTQRVGAVSLVALGVLVVMQVVIGDCNCHERYQVEVYFSHLGGLQQGAEMQVAGRSIGEIENIALVPSHVTTPGHPLYPTGGVEVSVAIEQRYSFMTAYNGEVFISTRGVFGQKYLEMGPPPAGERGRPLRQGDRLRGMDPPHLDRVLLRSQRSLELSRRFMNDIRPEWDELMAALDELGVTLDGFDVLPAAQTAAQNVAQNVGRSVRGVVAEARTLRQTLEQSGVQRADITRLLANAQATAARLDERLVTLRVEVEVLLGDVERLRQRVPDDVSQRLQRAFQSADASLAKMAGILRNTRAIITMVRRGEGTVGALWNDPEFPEHAKDLGRLIKKHPWLLVGHEKPAD